jgi:hypothetical protein
MIAARQAADANMSTAAAAAAAANSSSNNKLWFDHCHYYSLYLTM